MQQQRRRSGLILGLVALGGLALTDGPAPADSGPGPYYAKPAWDQSLPVLTQFLVLTDWNNDAVLDKETGLVWERAPFIPTMTWSAARLFCANRATGTRKGWRLPFPFELQSLTTGTEYPSTPPTLPLGSPFLGVQPAGYWSATTFAVHPTGAWLIELFGSNIIVDNKTATHHAWCVRSGMNEDQY
jgi:hypothetical protein